MKKLLLIGLLASCAGTSYATLGGAPSTTASAHPVVAQMEAMAQSRSRLSAYRQIQTTLASGTVVTEYADDTNTVFAVTWRGPVMPDLPQLLGPHYATLKAQAAKTPYAGHARLQLTRPEVAITSEGHMRAFSGRAWIPDALPAGFTADDLN